MDVRLKKVPFEFDGKQFVLSCNMNVLADVQEAYGGEISPALSGKATLKSVMTFLAAMINDYADEMGWAERYTSRQVGRIIDPNRLDETVKTIMDMVVDAVKSEESEESEKNLQTTQSQATA